jgi:hypothetical protein
LRFLQIFVQDEPTAPVWALKDNIMKTQILLAHFAPHFHGGGALVFLILFCLVVVIGLVFSGSPKDKDK